MPPPTLPSATGRRGRVQRVERVFGLHMEAVDVVEFAVPGFGDDRKRPPVAAKIGRAVLKRHLMVASRTTPTLWVLVIMTGPSRKPDSSTQVVPVISPLPLSENHPAKTGSIDALLAAREDGRHAGAHRPLPTTSLPFAGDERGEADFDASDVGDGVERARSAVERNAKIAGARRGLRKGTGSDEQKGQRQYGDRFMMGRMGDAQAV